MVFPNFCGLSYNRHLNEVLRRYKTYSVENACFVLKAIRDKTVAKPFLHLVNEAMSGDFKILYDKRLLQFCINFVTSCTVLCSFSQFFLNHTMIRLS